MNWIHIWSNALRPALEIGAITGTVLFALRLLALSLQTIRENRLRTSWRFGAIGGIAASVLVTSILFWPPCSLLFSAYQGSRSSQFDLGIAYLDGDSYFSVSPARSVFWFTKAAENGDKDAQFNLGSAYLRGIGISKDASKAALWFQKAADQGQMNAAAQLGTMYYLGLDLPLDSNRGLALLQASADAGNLDGIRALGNIYLFQANHPDLVQRGIKLLTSGASQGDPFCLYLLGFAHYSGIGVNRDPVVASSLFKAAIPGLTSKAQAQEPSAEGLLGCAYYFGFGVDRDQEKGRRLLTQGAAGGDLFSRNMLRDL